MPTSETIDYRFECHKCGNEWIQSKGVEHLVDDDPFCPSQGCGGRGHPSRLKGEDDMVETTGYIAVRKHIIKDPSEFFDFPTLCGDKDCAGKRAREIDKDIEPWAECNPVQRIVKVRMTEVSDE